MNESELQSTVRKYYRAWARQDRGEVRSLLADDLDFRSPQDRFTGAECLRVVAGKIHQVLVINNSPEFGELFAP